MSAATLTHKDFLWGVARLAYLTLDETQRAEVHARIKSADSFQNTSSAPGRELRVLIVNNLGASEVRIQWNEGTIAHPKGKVHIQFSLPFGSCHEFLAFLESA